MGIKILTVVTCSSGMPKVNIVVLLKLDLELTRGRPPLRH